MIERVKVFFHLADHPGMPSGPHINGDTLARLAEVERLERERAEEIRMLRMTGNFAEAGFVPIPPRESNHVND